MGQIEIVIGLLVVVPVVAVLATLAARLRVPYPILFVRKTWPRGTRLA